jgi:hypothetical protein
MALQAWCSQFSQALDQPGSSSRPIANHVHLGEIVTEDPVAPHIHMEELVHLSHPSHNNDLSLVKQEHRKISQNIHAHTRFNSRPIL